VQGGEGRIAALDLNTGAILWETLLDSAPFGGVTAINDLLFTSTFDGMVYALSRDSGEIVWTYQAPAGINGWMAATGDTILVPAGVGGSPQLVALRLGAEMEEEAAAEEDVATEEDEETMAEDEEEAMAEEDEETMAEEEEEAMGEQDEQAAGPAPMEQPTATMEAAEGEPTVVEVEARNFEFVPDTFEFSVGETVTFIVESTDVYHTFTVKESEDATEDMFNLELYPDDDPVEYTHTWEEAGTYYLYCIPHEGLGMTGEIVVQ
jgi:plastocyanin